MVNAMASNAVSGYSDLFGCGRCSRCSRWLVLPVVGKWITCTGVARVIALLNRWELWVEEEEPAPNGLLWSMLPNRACLWLLPWCSTCTSVSHLQSISAPEPLDTRQAPSPRMKARQQAGTGGPRPPSESDLVAAISTLTDLTYVLVPFELDDEDLAHCHALRTWRISVFITRRLTEAGTASILKLQKLNGLTILFDDPTCVSVGAISRLSQLPSLEFLYGSPCRVRPSGSSRRPCRTSMW